MRENWSFPSATHTSLLAVVITPRRARASLHGWGALPCCATGGAGLATDRARGFSLAAGVPAYFFSVMLMC